MGGTRTKGLVHRLRAGPLPSAHVRGPNHKTGVRIGRRRVQAQVKDEPTPDSSRQSHEGLPRSARKGHRQKPHAKGAGDIKQLRALVDAIATDKVDAELPQLCFEIISGESPDAQLRTILYRR